MRTAALMLLAALTLQCTNPKILDKRLHKKWASKAVFSTPESVVFDPIRNEYYVSNINGEPDEKNGFGIISRVSIKGEMLQPNWIHRLNAPKGMALDGYSLFVTDIDRLLEIDTKTGSIFTQYNLQNARFVSDVAIGPGRTLYVSDTYWNRIYRITENSTDILVESDELNHPEGLSVRDGLLFVGTLNSVVTVDLSTGMISDYALNTGPVHGINAQVDGTCLISNWHGQLVLIGENGYRKTLLDGISRNINISDFMFFPGPNLIVIPTFYNNKLIAYEWNPNGAN